MSLFKLRTWWATNCGVDEEFDTSCLCLANIDNCSDGSLKIITGGFGGVLRIFLPKERDFHPNDLLLEQNLGAPILSLAAGRFLPNMKNVLGLAILFPRRLVVYALNQVSSQAAEQGTYYILERRYEHRLEHTACNMTYGPFAGVYDRDYICVQSMDGVLEFFEQDSLAFMRYLSGFLLPGPLCYVAKTDCFVTCNSQFVVECYRHRNLAAAVAEERKDEDRDIGLTVQKHLQTEWTVNVGEPVLDIFVARFSWSLASSQLDIVAIVFVTDGVVKGDKHIFCLKENGGIRLQKRMEFYPSCATAFYPASEDEHMNQHLLVASHYGSYNLYRDMQLIWSAKGDMVPVAMGVGKFGELDGLVVSLEDRGRLGLTYMGTDPAASSVAPAGKRRNDVDSINEELKKLEGIVQNLFSSTPKEPADRISMRIQLPSGPDAEANSGILTEDGVLLPTASLRLAVSYNGDAEVHNVQITVNLPEPFRTPQTLFTVETLRGGTTPLVYPMPIHATISGLPADNVLTAVAIYSTERGEARAARAEVGLPLFLISHLIAPIKPSAHQLVLDTNRPGVSLRTLLSDLILPGSGAELDKGTGGANAITISFYCGPKVPTVHIGRYRLQSTSFSAFWPVIQDLSARLEKHFMTLGEHDTQSAPASFKMTLLEKSLPFANYFPYLDAHFERRQELADISKLLETETSQFRAVQKRLLVRYRDRNTAPISDLFTLMANTYGDILKSASLFKKKQRQLSLAGRELSACTRLMQLLIRYRYNLDEKNFVLFQNYFSAIVVDGDEQGWEESVDSSLTQLLRVGFATCNKDQSFVVPQLQSPSSTNRIKQLLPMVCERLSQNYRLAEHGRVVTSLANETQPPSIVSQPSGRRKKSEKTNRQ